MPPTQPDTDELLRQASQGDREATCSGTRC
jgi:hypothetical protein